MCLARWAAKRVMSVGGREGGRGEGRGVGGREGPTNIIHRTLRAEPLWGDVPSPLGSQACDVGRWEGGREGGGEGGGWERGTHQHNSSHAPGRTSLG